MPAFALPCHPQMGASESGSHRARAGEATLAELRCRKVVIPRQFLREALSRTQLENGGAADRHLDITDVRN